MTDDYDKKQWQAEQAARDSALEKQREKERKTRERSARNAKRKLERLQRTLKENGNITDWEDEFSESVSERLDKFGSAFQDREKGRPGDALSFSQKRVMSALNKKVKDAKKARKEAEAEAGDDDFDPDAPTRPKYTPRSSFKSKGKPKFTPRVRHIEDDFIEEDPPRPKPAPFIPEFVKDVPKKSRPKALPQLNESALPKKKPSLKAVPSLPKKTGSVETQSTPQIEPPEAETPKARPSFLRLISEIGEDED